MAILRNVQKNGKAHVPPAGLVLLTIDKTDFTSWDFKENIREQFL